MGRAVVLVLGCSPASPLDCIAPGPGLAQGGVDIQLGWRESLPPLSFRSPEHEWWGSSRKPSLVTPALGARLVFALSSELPVRKSLRIPCPECVCVCVCRMSTIPAMLDLLLCHTVLALEEGLAIH